MMNALRSALNRKDLSPSSARWLEATVERATTARAAARLSASGAAARRRDGLSRCQTASADATTATPTLARRKRGASPKRLNSHHSSREYSVCLWTKKPNQAATTSTTITATPQPTVKRSPITEAWRLNSPRHGTRMPSIATRKSDSS